MSSYQDVVKDMFRKHKGKASKDIMRMASAEWNKVKGMSGRGLPDDASLLTNNGGKLKERKKRVPNVSAMGPLSEIPNFDSTGPSPYGEYIINKQLKTLPASRVQVVKQLNFSGRAPTGRAGMGMSGGDMSATDSKDFNKVMGLLNSDLKNSGMSAGDLDSDLKVAFGGDFYSDLREAYGDKSGGNFWDDVGDFFSSPSTWVDIGLALI